MKMKKRWLLWSLLFIGTFAVLARFVVLRPNDDQRLGQAMLTLPIREWPKAKEVSAEEYLRTLDMVYRSRAMGMVLLPKTTTPIATVAAKSPHELGIVPPQVCGQCHAEHWNGCQQTAHFRTTSRFRRAVQLLLCQQKECRIGHRL